MEKIKKICINQFFNNKCLKNLLRTLEIKSQLKQKRIMPPYRSTGPKRPVPPCSTSGPKRSELLSVWEASLLSFLSVLRRLGMRMLLLLLLLCLMMSFTITLTISSLEGTRSSCKCQGQIRITGFLSRLGNKLYKSSYLLAHPFLLSKVSCLSY